MSRDENTMEKLRQLVMSQYNSAPEEAQVAAQQFYTAMDGDGNGSVDYREFMEFMICEGYEEYARRDLFKRLDTDGNRSLDFWEVMSFYYIIKSKKPFCFGCDDFLLNDSSVCNNCPGNPYHFCKNCYQYHNAVVGGEHNNIFMMQESGDSMHGIQASNALVIYSSAGNSSDSSSGNPSWSSSSHAMVPLENRVEYRKRLLAYKVFEMAVNMANLVVGVASCVIM